MDNQDGRQARWLCQSASGPYSLYRHCGPGVRGDYCRTGAFAVNAQFNHWGLCNLSVCTDSGDGRRCPV